MQTPNEALAVLEIDGVTRALVAHDAALKRADVCVIACAPVTPGKTVLVFHGDVAATQEAFASASAAAASHIIDRFLLAQVHPQVVQGLYSRYPPLGVRAWAAMGCVECDTVATTLHALDAALKGAEVTLERLHLACGYGGKGFFTLRGDVGDIEAAHDAAMGVGADHIIDTVVLAAPHEDLPKGFLVRTFAADPCYSDSA